ncbi:hypothetical protein V5799_009644 [Amblyomma americanum]|uniref:Uncharacterized protein n=1 Tax=Amblyomma americanum TaxID=6943 RepID=A0AAQ4F9X1_AMBAM
MTSAVLFPAGRRRSDSEECEAISIRGRSVQSVAAMSGYRFRNVTKKSIHINRHFYRFMNVQLVVDSRYRIIDVAAPTIRELWLTGAWPNDGPTVDTLEGPGLCHHSELWTCIPQKELQCCARYREGDCGKDDRAAEAGIPLLAWRYALFTGTLRWGLRGAPTDKH